MKSCRNEFFGEQKIESTSWGIKASVFTHISLKNTPIDGVFTDGSCGGFLRSRFFDSFFSSHVSSGPHFRFSLELFPARKVASKNWDL